MRRPAIRRLAALLLLLFALLPGCAVVALPFRVTGDVIGVVPDVGKPLGAPFRAGGDAID